MAWNFNSEQPAKDKRSRNGGLVNDDEECVSKTKWASLGRFGAMDGGENGAIMCLHSQF